MLGRMVRDEQVVSVVRRACLRQAPVVIAGARPWVWGRAVAGPEDLHQAGVGG